MIDLYIADTFAVVGFGFPFGVAVWQTTKNQ